MLACELADHRSLKESLEKEMAMIRAKPAAQSKDELEERRRAHEGLARQIQAAEDWFYGGTSRCETLKEYARKRRGG